jgi:small-conductance mechanosensitive channel
VDDRIVALLHRPIFISVLLFGSSLALKILEAHGVFFRIFQTIFAFVWVVALLRISLVISGVLPRILPGDSRAGQHLGTLTKNLTAVVLLSLGVMAVLSIWQVSVTPLLASAGIVGAAVAFASKDTIANFLGGISILVDRPYSVGHYIILDSGERGEVVDIGLRSTRIKTRDDFRIRTPVGVAYGTDIDQVEALLLEIAAASPGVENEPEPRVRFRSFGDSALLMELLCWVDDPMNRGRIGHELNKEIYRKFNEEGIVIPFPQRDVHHYGGTERDAGTSRR